MTDGTWVHKYRDGMEQTMRANFKTGITVLEYVGRAECEQSIPAGKLTTLWSKTTCPACKLREPKPKGEDDGVHDKR